MTKDCEELIQIKDVITTFENIYVVMEKSPF